MATSGRLMGPSLLVAPAGVDSGGFYSHGGEEFVYVMEGVLYVEVAGRGEFRLEPEDTLYFPSTAEHRWWTTDSPVRAVWVNMPQPQ